MSTKELIEIGVSQKSFPQYLFKYRADNENTLRIITHKELWFSNPQNFNDPYDCNTPINETTPLSDIKAWLRSVGIGSGNIDKLSADLVSNPDLMKQSIDGVLSRTGICCFSTIYDSILQWSHYSDYHKGVCFKFEITADPEFFCYPIIVSYRQTMQHYNHFIQSNKIVEYLIQPKFADWSYESEVRVVKLDTLMQQNENRRAFRFANNALKEVIFGTKTPESIKNKYRQLCADNGMGHIQFSQMELDQGPHYKLNKYNIL